MRTRGKKGIQKTESFAEVISVWPLTLSQLKILSRSRGSISQTRTRLGPILLYPHVEVGGLVQDKRSRNGMESPSFSPFLPLWAAEVSSCRNRSRKGRKAVSCRLFQFLSKPPGLRTDSLSSVHYSSRHC